MYQNSLAASARPPLKTVSSLIPLKTRLLETGQKAT